MSQCFTPHLLTVQFYSSLKKGMFLLCRMPFLRLFGAVKCDDVT